MSIVLLYHRLILEQGIIMCLPSFRFTDQFSMLCIYCFGVTENVEIVKILFPMSPEKQTRKLAIKAVVVDYFTITVRVTRLFNCQKDKFSESPGCHSLGGRSFHNGRRRERGAAAEKLLSPSLFCVLGMRIWKGSQPVITEVHSDCAERIINIFFLYTGSRWQCFNMFHRLQTVCRRRISWHCSAPVLFDISTIVIRNFRLFCRLCGLWLC